MNLNIYYVQPGDTVQTVAEKFHIRVQDLIQMNYMAVPEVVVGQRLWSGIKSYNVETSKNETCNTWNRK